MDTTTETLPQEPARNESYWRDRAQKVEAFLKRYFKEVPLGHQPHMMAHEVEAFLEGK